MARDHVVQPGDCISSLAAENGLVWEDLWNHPQNSELRRKRKDPNILFPGDVVFIPEIDLRVETRSTGKRHTFVCGNETKVRFRLLMPERANPEARSDRGSAANHGSRHVVDEDPEQDGEPKEVPLANTPYTLTVDGRVSNGTTDGQGYIEEQIPPTARSGSLRLKVGTPDETIIPFQLGYLDPLDEIAGVKQRLRNLGFESGDSSAEETDGFSTAICAFQEMQGLPVSGSADAATLNGLKDTHGS